MVSGKVVQSFVFVIFKYTVCRYFLRDFTSKPASAHGMVE